MDIRNQANGNTRITLSDTELMDALENYFHNVFEHIPPDAYIQEITNRYGNIEIIVGQTEER